IPPILYCDGSFSRGKQKNKGGDISPPESASQQTQYNEVLQKKQKIGQLKLLPDKIGKFARAKKHPLRILIQ
ncbi:MAG: hypothetical protein RSA97_04105, partial [Oscillospiraceae bacterium]